MNVNLPKTSSSFGGEFEQTIRSIESISPVDTSSEVISAEVASEFSTPEQQTSDSIKKVPAQDITILGAAESKIKLPTEDLVERPSKTIPLNTADKVTQHGDLEEEEFIRGVEESHPDAISSII